MIGQTLGRYKVEEKPDAELLEEAVVADRAALHGCSYGSGIR